MRTLILFLCLALPLTAQEIRTTDDGQIEIDGVVAGSAADAAANYPDLAKPIRQAAKARRDARLAKLWAAHLRDLYPMWNPKTDPLPEDMPVDWEPDSDYLERTWRRWLRATVPDWRPDRESLPEPMPERWTKPVAQAAMAWIDQAAEKAPAEADGEAAPALVVPELSELKVEEPAQ